MTGSRSGIASVPASAGRATCSPRRVVPLSGRLNARGGGEAALDGAGPFLAAVRVVASAGAAAVGEEASALADLSGVTYKLPVVEPARPSFEIEPVPIPGPKPGDGVVQPGPSPQPIPGPEPGPGIIRAPFPWVLLFPERTVNIGGSGLIVR